MENMTFDAFTKKIYIKAPIEKLYWCWATKKGIESWFLRQARYLGAEGQPRQEGDMIQVGDSYIWEWYNWNGSETGSVLRANGSNLLEFSFTGDSKVSIVLEDNGSAVLVSLTQFDIPLDDTSKMDIYNGCSCGWTFWLTNLKAYLEHGILLNEKKFDLTEIPQAGHIYINM